jgi:hypothetical protein
MLRLLALFAPHCNDRTTMDSLTRLIPHKGTWQKAYGVFGEIRHKSIATHRMHNTMLSAQYYFEEACAKTLYNLSGNPAPFDNDSPYWVVPSALLLARELGLSDAMVGDIVAR